MNRLAAVALSLAMLHPVGAAEPDVQISRAGTRAVNAASAQNFAGTAIVEMLHAPAGPERASGWPNPITAAGVAREVFATKP